MSKRYEKAETQLIISCVGGNYTLHLISAKSPFYDKRCHATKHDLSSIDIGHVYNSEVFSNIIILSKTFNTHNNFDFCMIYFILENIVKKLF